RSYAAENVHKIRLLSTQPFGASVIILSLLAIRPTKPPFKSSMVLFCQKSRMLCNSFSRSSLNCCNIFYDFFKKNVHTENTNWLYLFLYRNRFFSKVKHDA